ncbi:MAG: PQQ-dependent dehydrogenase, methanol/ethanol family [Phenylobacterium sp.]
MRVLTRLGVLLAVGLVLSACHRGVDGSRIEQAKAGEWLTYGRTYDEQRFSPLKQINAQTIGKLGVAWWAEFDTDRGQEATPLIADGVLYTTTAWSKVFAFDAKTGKPLWTFDPKVPGEKGFNACCDVVNRGVALWDGMVYVGTIDGRLIALDGKTGQPEWTVQTTNPDRPYTITGAPRAIRGKILIGNGGAEYGVRGYVSAFDAKTGNLDWRFYMTPNPRGFPDDAASDKIMKTKAAATWSDGYWRQTGGGGTPWDAITYDPKLNLVFVGAGNGNPWNHKLRSGGKGDNLFLSSIVALRPDTGEYVWHYQTTPGESWDYTAVQHIMLADLKIGGETRRVVMQAPKNGFFYVLDAATGKLISAEKYAPVDWAEKIDLKTGRPIEAPWARYPNGTTSHQIAGALGGHNWQPMAFSPREQLVYIPTMANPGNYADPVNFRYIPGAWNTGERRGLLGPSAPKVEPRAGTPFGELVAWDPAAQKARWKVRFPQTWTSGVLATDAGLVFHTAGSLLSAYDAKRGDRVWAYDLGAGAIAPASTYEIDGQQYLALMVGYGGAAMGNDQPRRKGRLLVFKLGGDVKPPAYPAVVAAGPLDLSAAEGSTGDADKGGTGFATYCGTCHKNGGVYLPNLTRSPAILSRDGFKAIVFDGALKDRGMAPFKHFMTSNDVEDVRAFLLWQAKQAPAAASASPVHAQ